MTAKPRKADEQPAPVEAKPEPRPFISEGVRDEIARTGRAVDPVTGRVLTREDLP